MKIEEIWSKYWWKRSNKEGIMLGSRKYYYLMSL